MDISVVITGLLAGAVSSMGLGGGGILLIYLTAFLGVEQMKAQGINLLFFLPVGLLAVLIYSLKRQIKWKTILKMWVGGIAGAGVGFLLARLISTYWLSKIFAVILVVFGLYQLFLKEKKEKNDLI